MTDSKKKKEIRKMHNDFTEFDAHGQNMAELNMGRSEYEDIINEA